MMTQRIMIEKVEGGYVVEVLDIGRDEPNILRTIEKHVCRDFSELRDWLFRYFNVDGKKV